ncbi:hypothetical protein BJ508DRAFT_413750 [Ascobolus immersus RN42]|uniref:RBR-type E3 ubiquitin transferase n=1 Tax=Ascobolus immersus RN42 TaxID=1160509 RepID=A0A3N4IG31_ASCIM|nr:hypothetical protein BJ508DRAFT_413750 [Ascobolus immersus RN42]
MTNMLHLSTRGFPGASSGSSSSHLHRVHQAHIASLSNSQVLDADDDQDSDVEDESEDASLRLAIALQLQEVEDILAVSEGKGKAPASDDDDDEDDDDEEGTDASLALREYSRELEELRRFEVDAKFAKEAEEKRMLIDLTHDGEEEVTEREKRVLEDRRLAMALEKGMISDEESKGSVSQERLLELLGPLERSLRDVVVSLGGEERDQEVKALRIAKRRTSVLDAVAAKPQSSIYIHSNETATTIAGPSISPAEKRQLVAEENDWVECDVCNEEFLRKSALRASCSHWYCIDCMKKQFLVARHDESVFPVKCCKMEIPFSLIRQYLSKVDVEYYLEKAEEYQTKNRIYCSNTDCGAFIKPGDVDEVEGVGKCGMCKTRTCSLCKRAAHEEGEDCPEDKDLTLCLEEADRHGWQRCPNCKTLVELSYGCRHMTCRCKSEWCYKCKSVWKTCECGDYDDQEED